MARAIVGLLLVCMILCVVGLPVPPPAKNASETASFPCIDSPCGCNTAEQCWDSCCCYNDAEKIAWAKEHQVLPPAFVVARYEATLIANTKPSCCAASPNSSSGSPGGNSASLSCCGKKKAESLQTCENAYAEACEEGLDSAPDQRNCCGTDENSVEKGARGPQGVQGHRGSRVVFWNALQKCRGIDLVWTLLATGWIPDRQENTKVPDPLLVDTYVIEDADSESIILEPDPPVPWFWPLV